MKDKTFFRWLIIFLGVVAIVGYCFSPTFAEDEIASPMTGIQQEDDSMSAPPLEDPEIFDDNFGQNYQYTWVPSAAYIPALDAVFYQLKGYKYRVSGFSYAVAPVNLPSGAYLNAAQFYFYDADSSSVNTFLYRYYWPDNYQELGGCASSGTPGYSYCTFYPNHTIRNGDSVYQLWVQTNSTSMNCKFMGVRLYWRRQINTGLSHPFTDIGGLSAEFQASIAALYQSGITTGTSSTTFSPNNPVTRGQFATFFARALGLHWSYPY